MAKASGSSGKPSAAEIPFTRRRLLPQQVASLQALFEAKSHPSKEERGAIASELGLELKAVNVWYQNRRRSAKKQALAWKPNIVPVQHRIPTSSKSTTSFSLDRIAASRERRDVPSQPQRLPLSPKANCLVSDTVSSTSDIWEHIPSSPQAPPSSPAAESARLSNLPNGSKTLRSLEWACAKARAEGKPEEDSDEDFDIPSTDYKMLRSSSSLTSVKLEEMVLDDGRDDTDTELHEAVTPDTSLSFSEARTTPKKYDWRRSKENSIPVPAEQVEAAMTLLVFKDS